MFCDRLNSCGGGQDRCCEPSEHECGGDNVRQCDAPHKPFMNNTCAAIQLAGLCHLVRAHSVCPCSCPPWAGGCKNLEGWKDSRGTGCDVYEQNNFCDLTSINGLGVGWPTAWVPPAQLADDNGTDASQACCQCGGGRFPPPTSNSTDAVLRFTCFDGMALGGGVYVRADANVEISEETLFRDNTVSAVSDIVDGSAAYLKDIAYLRMMDTKFEGGDGSRYVGLSGVPPADCTALRPCANGSSCTYDDHSLSCRPCGSAQISDGLQCTTCESGTEPSVDSSACLRCAAQDYGTDGKCAPCGRGTLPNTQHTVCESAHASTVCEQAPERRLSHNARHCNRDDGIVRTRTNGTTVRGHDGLLFFPEPEWWLQTTTGLCVLAHLGDNHTSSARS